MLQIAVFSERRDYLLSVKTAVEAYVGTEKIPCRILAVESYSRAVGVDFGDLCKSDILLVDFASQKPAALLIAALSEKNSELLWVCMGTGLAVFRKLLLYRPCGYVPEPWDPSAFQEELARVERFWRRKDVKRYFTFKMEGDYVRVPYANISYFESSGKKVTLHQYPSGQKHSILIQLKDIQEQAPACFLRCHQSYLVNMNFIRAFDTREKLIVVLPNDTVQISRRMYTQTKEIYDSFMKKNSL